MKRDIAIDPQASLIDISLFFVSWFCSNVFFTMLFFRPFVLAVLLALSITYGQASPIAGAVEQRAPWNQQPVCETSPYFKYGAVWDQLWALRRTLCSGQANFVSLRGYDIDHTVSVKENGKTRYINVKWKSYLHENHGEQGYPDCYVSFRPRSYMSVASWGGANRYCSRKPQSMSSLLISRPGTL